ncbi:maleylpyruvate isomerase N-terminal domain-containing protein [Arsenicicoccus piscis]|uniref:Mycothiol-dependent maleylpyruvate isomerase metal-binding domain-containing protein n=1 Tax=Arsenicicoccus piscis TaxID=673954 RepID=A0ABQ6HMJ0_9MICO|nr:maleylpyruvate isomerase N-terminal domain-containing protein [Arsenicicoccus piscis]GMA18893.1 hypothetical protein GCM10025862_09140 [Arsenicicoccus piscis]
MATLNCSLQQAASEFAAQARSFLSAAEGLDERELLDPARCRGWSRLDAVVHVRVGLDEMSAVAGVHSRAPIDHDAASYWRTHPDDRDADPVPHILVLRRTASAYQRPASAVRHLTEVVHRAIAVVDGMPDQPVAFQGKTLAAGDFVATWVVELAVHQLDLALHDAPPGAAWHARRWRLWPTRGCRTLWTMRRRSWSDSVVTPGRRTFHARTASRSASETSP